MQVTLLEARSLPVWGFPWQSNPWCRLVLGNQTVTSRRDDDTSREGSHRAPVWNQEFQLLVESPSTQVRCCPAGSFLCHMSESSFALIPRISGKAFLPSLLYSKCESIYCDCA